MRPGDWATPLWGTSVPVYWRPDPGLVPAFQLEGFTLSMVVCTCDRHGYDMALLIMHGCRLGWVCVGNLTAVPA